METIPQTTLRNELGAVLRRVEEGAEFIVTVAGRPVAELGPVRRRRWIGGPALARAWRSPAPTTLAEDLAAMPAEIILEVAAERQIRGDMGYSEISATSFVRAGRDGR